MWQRFTTWSEHHQLHVAIARPLQVFAELNIDTSAPAIHWDTQLWHTVPADRNNNSEPNPTISRGDR